MHLTHSLSRVKQSPTHEVSVQILQSLCCHLVARCTHQTAMPLNIHINLSQVTLLFY